MRLKSRPKDFTWAELQQIMGHFGYKEVAGGGSRRKFVDNTNHIISLHKPHPGNVLKRYQINDVIDALNERGKLNND